ncbi:MAG: BppU family phage baseplate upper protein [Eubacteriales bacterium]
MVQIIKEITVDTARQNVFFRAIVAKQYDVQSRFLKVTVCNEGKKISIDENATVLINACRADKEAKAFAGTVNEDGTVTVPLTSWMLELDDVVVCDISIIDTEGRRLTSTSFNVEVESAAYTGEISEEENYDLLVTLIADCGEAKSGCETATENAEAAASVANAAAIAADNAATAANTAKGDAEAAASNANTAATAADNAAAAANTAKADASAAANMANAAAERAETAAQAVGDEIDGILIKDTDNALRYLAQFRLIGGKPVLEYTEI